MILPDSSIWIDHFRRSNPHLNAELEAERIVGHPFVTGEVALGSIARREWVIARLAELPPLRPAGRNEVAGLIEAQHLWDCGIGYVDACLLAAVRMAPGTRLWTRDRRLHDQARRLGVVHGR